MGLCYNDGNSFNRFNISRNKEDWIMNICSICNSEIDDRFGHNAWPINDGTCCDTCNMTVVVPKRIENLKKAEELY